MRQFTPAAAPAPTPPPAPVAEPAAAAGSSGGGEEEEIDETDPLWVITLQIANGDRAAALKMLEDPDALMANPVVMKVSDANTHVVWSL